MNFDDAYQLLEIVESDNERTTYVAREVATGSYVFVHLLSKQSDLATSLLTVAKRYAASQSDASSIELKIGILRNEDCLVTKVAPELKNIRRVLDGTSHKGSFDKAGMWKVPATIETIPDTGPKTTPVGEFTRMFSPENVEPTSSQQGEFTRMFQAPADKPSVPDTPFLPKSPPVSPSPEGEFTQMFSTPKQSAPGEFTQMFRGEPSESPALEPTKQPAARSSERSQPGEFTRMFKPDAASETASKENWLDFVEKPQSNNSLDNINWGSSQVQGATGAFAVPTVPTTSPAPPSVPEGPSDFTRLIAVQSTKPQQTETPVASSDTAQPAQPQPSQKATSNLPIIIGINVVILTVIALILYFVLKG